MHKVPLTLSPDDVYATLLSMLSDMMATVFPQIPGTADTSHKLHLQAEYLSLPGNSKAFIHKVCTFFCLEPTQSFQEFLENKIEIYALAHAVAEELLTKDEVHICFHSSGSTGSPKQHIYPLSVCQAEVIAVLEHLPSFSRVISVMPVHHIFGFIFTLLLPKQAHVPHKHFSPIALSSLVQALLPGDIVIGFPFFWKNIGNLLHQEKTDPPSWSGAIHAISSTSPCPQDIPQLLLGLHDDESKYVETFTEIYGSTETSAVGIRRYPFPYYRLLSNWRAARNHSAVSNIYRCKPPARSLQPTPMPDIVQWAGSDSFIPIRRHDNAVQVAGQNVYPQRIAQTLMSHPCIQHCAVRLMRPDEGMRLKAFIVPADNNPKTLAQLQPKALREWCSARLDPPSIPRLFALGSELPQTPMGKSSDW